MKVNDWKAIVESLLFAAGDEGLTIKQLMHVLEMEQLEVEQLIDELIKSYRKDKTRGISIIEIAGTYQFATKKEHSDYLKKLVESPHASTLSQAALETLAIIAYKQPITRAEIEEIRGVKTERPLHTLSAKALIKEVGRAEGAGRAILYGTTKEFLDHFGLKNLGELPPLAEKEEEFNQEEADLFFESFQQIEE
ncbi:SMC-Scp complex subunit ScpB [Cytobacillus oceanisediminis]|uniref:Segregation and condensation protein B n=2 Tax=Niallia TaxID=2837506 RepID=A0A941GPK1_NIACI|nr:MULTISPECIES: SMC-Scp complex subunit ScpB [Bacillaceae]MBQ6447376.1 SMC-Scp complex subunit ScpB [Bacillus sp. (in: firmicutes)]MDU1844320.1 SMC-Scp complex subunit ScpB [Niallia nealsonii]MBZ9533898.1 SMC-Scp complex subunit ScpB [Cytobacillus oceanisediminis]MCB5238774.1 SMC-Scp complex subunit ScpB [Niallia circulans]MED3792233.1 SMC-Scp complex subunit ScpB [Niallia alba]